MISRNGTSKTSEIVIKDKHREIRISTNPKPLKSNIVKAALMALSKTAINRLHFRRYQITETLVETTPIDSSRYFNHIHCCTLYVVILLIIN